jgi:hypothetical protein
MAKQQTFADKAAKAAAQHGKKCQKCGAIKLPVLYVSSEPSKHGSTRFSHRRIQVCQCNEKEIYS